MNPGILPLAAALAAAATGVDFFENRIRPLLAEKCYPCHSSKTVATSGLRLDSRSGVLKGGSRGAAVVPGEPESSPLIRAVSYQGPDLAMPPSGKLAPEQIADLVAWVKMGAPDPRGDAPPPASVQVLDLAKGRQFWSLRPVEDYLLPPVKNKAWPKSPIDRFLLARLEAKGLSPAPPADKATLLRRVTFDLIGLPPTRREIEDFLADRSPQAFGKVVDRLLASPHYGERWARHWLDLARFAETRGHEFDPDTWDAWRYRDYVIRAFNEDLPYDRFIKEHLAGDLLADGRPRESPLGGGFFGLGEERNAADDVAEVRADRVDNQIDVMTKTFLGLTVACARCHDHKFDPLSTEDYYALAGVLHSTRIIEANLDPPARRDQIESAHQRVVQINQRIGSLLGPALAGLAGQLRATLLKPTPPWTAYLEEAAKQPDHVFYPFAALSKTSETPFPERLAAVRKELERWDSDSAGRGDVIFEGFEKPDFPGWEVNGAAFGPGPLGQTAPNHALAGFQGAGMASSFRGGSDTLVGVLTSRSFRVTKPYLHVRLAGTIDKSRRRENGALRFTLAAPGRPAFVALDKPGVLQWKTAGLKRQEGEICYFEIADRSREGHIVVDRIILSESKEPPRFASPPNRWVLAALARPGVASLEDLAAAYQAVVLEALAGPPEDRDTRRLQAALSPTGRREDLPGLPQEIAALAKQRAEAEAAIPESAFGMALRDDDPRDVAVHQRGSHRHLGRVVARRFLEVLDPKPFARGSGRLELAEAIASPNNPLAARVMVNRIWQHHFGHGLVRSTDNFGQTGERPTHPELLDFLARRFVQSGWSVKAMHRLMILSSAYRMSSRGPEAALRADPENRLLARMPVRRLEAEAIRDAILAVAGSLDRAVYGPSVPPHISAYQDGRGRPAQSGPLDGNGRRSIYIQVRRNFITPMFLAFDYPLPGSTIGQRSVSTVPSQALTMMNNEFVVAQSRLWAERVAAAQTGAGGRLQDMFWTAFARSPEPWEIQEAGGFLAAGGNWADLAHVLFNSKEFLFVR